MDSDAGYSQGKYTNEEIPNCGERYSNVNENLNNNRQNEYTHSNVRRFSGKSVFANEKCKFQTKQKKACIY